ncbi:unnamed protein product [Amoebophrya sp. A120]|nr:unnamed protein product [Amoebophrya sp. A120]|eukprot:GSA120T00018200001.1
MDASLESLFSLVDSGAPQSGIAGVNGPATSATISAKRPREPEVLNGAAAHQQDPSSVGLKRFHSDAAASAAGAAASSPEGTTSGEAAKLDDLLGLSGAGGSSSSSSLCPTPLLPIQHQPGGGAAGSSSGAAGGTGAINYNTSSTSLNNLVLGPMVTSASGGAAGKGASASSAALQYGATWNFSGGNRPASSSHAIWPEQPSPPVTASAPGGTNTGGGTGTNNPSPNTQLAQIFAVLGENKPSGTAGAGGGGGQSSASSSPGSVLDNLLNSVNENTKPAAAAGTLNLGGLNIKEQPVVAQPGAAAQQPPAPAPNRRAYPQNTNSGGGLLTNNPGAGAAPPNNHAAMNGNANANPLGNLLNPNLWTTANNNGVSSSSSANNVQNADPEDPVQAFLQTLSETQRSVSQQQILGGGSSLLANAKGGVGAGGILPTSTNPGAGTTAGVINIPGATATAGAAPSSSSSGSIFSEPLQTAGPGNSQFLRPADLEQLFRIFVQRRCAKGKGAGKPSLPKLKQDFVQFVHTLKGKAASKGMAFSFAAPGSVGGTGGGGVAFAAPAGNINAAATGSGSASGIQHHLGHLPTGGIKGGPQDGLRSASSLSRFFVPPVVDQAQKDLREKERLADQKLKEVDALLAEVKARSEKLAEREQAVNSTGVVSSTSSSSSGGPGGGGGPTAVKTRADFATDEEYEAYKAAPNKYSAKDWEQWWSWVADGNAPAPGGPPQPSTATGGTVQQSAASSSTAAPPNLAGFPHFQPQAFGAATKGNFHPQPTGMLQHLQASMGGKFFAPGKFGSKGGKAGPGGAATAGAAHHMQQQFNPAALPNFGGGGPGAPHKGGLGGGYNNHHLKGGMIPAPGLNGMVPPKGGKNSHDHFTPNHHMQHHGKPGGPPYKGAGAPGMLPQHQGGGPPPGIMPHLNGAGPPSGGKPGVGAATSNPTAQHLPFGHQPHGSTTGGPVMNQQRNNTGGSGGPGAGVVAGAPGNNNASNNSSSTTTGAGAPSSTSNNASATTTTTPKGSFLNSKGYAAFNPSPAVVNGVGPPVHHSNMPLVGPPMNGAMPIHPIGAGPPPGMVGVGPPNMIHHQHQPMMNGVGPPGTMNGVVLGTGPHQPPPVPPAPPVHQAPPPPEPKNSFPPDQNPFPDQQLLPRSDSAASENKENSSQQILPAIATDMAAGGSTALSVLKSVHGNSNSTANVLPAAANHVKDSGIAIDVRKPLSINLRTNVCAPAAGENKENADPVGVLDKENQQPGIVDAQAGAETKPDTTAGKSAEQLAQEEQERKFQEILVGT